MIETKNLVKSFHSIEVLKGVSETIQRGEKVAIIGPSGSGKSTFLRCLNLLERPTSGEIWFEGDCISDKGADINAVRQRMGMVFQHFNLFPHLTILDNIMLRRCSSSAWTSPRRKRKQWNCSSVSDSRIRPRRIPQRCPAAKSSGSQSYGRSL